jgi:opacity protein-like surface antigen
MPNMKPLTLTLALLVGLCVTSFAGPEPMSSGKEMKQVAPAPCPEWYSDNEWNLSAWWSYAFAGTDNNRPGIEDVDDFNEIGTYDRFLSQDHAWGGGLDLKYFWHRYFGLGVEGFGLAGRSSHAVLDHGSQAADEEFYQTKNHSVWGAMGTFTLRYPFHCSRFSPYAWAGGGGVFNGYNDQPVGHDLGFTDHFDGQTESKVAGQFGGGLEIRVTRHIGITGDFSWNVVDGSHNNFGMVRSGLNFAF